MLDCGYEKEKQVYQETGTYGHLSNGYLYVPSVFEGMSIERSLHVAQQFLDNRGGNYKTSNK